MLVVGLYEGDAAAVVPQLLRAHVDVLRPEDLPSLVRRQTQVREHLARLGGRRRVSCWLRSRRVAAAGCSGTQAPATTSWHRTVRREPYESVMRLGKENNGPLSVVEAVLKGQLEHIRLVRETLTCGWEGRRAVHQCACRRRASMDEALTCEALVWNLGVARPA